MSELAYLINNLVEDANDYKDNGGVYDEDDVRDILDRLSTDVLVLAEKIKDLL
jgi:hypothetical protein